MRNVSGRNVLTSGVAAAGALALSGCTNLGGGGGDDSLKLGVLAPMSGPAESIGPRFENATEIAIRVYPEEYGVLADTDIEYVTQHGVESRDRPGQRRWPRRGPRASRRG